MKNSEIMKKYIQKVENGVIDFDEALNELYELSASNSELYLMMKEYEKSGVEAMIGNGVLTIGEYAKICNVDFSNCKDDEYSIDEALKKVNELKYQ